jgi:hypothetical protein
MNSLSSHHSLLMTGRNAADLRLVAKVFNLTLEEI